MKRDESINRHVNIYITDFFKVFESFIDDLGCGLLLVAEKCNSRRNEEKTNRN